MYVHKSCTAVDNHGMTYEEKCALARTGETSQEAVGFRLAAARRAVGLSQQGLADAAGVKKQAISNAENGRSYAGREALIFLYREHRIDINFTMYGTFTQLPGDVQDRLFAELSDATSEPDQKQRSS